MPDGQAPRLHSLDFLTTEQCRESEDQIDSTLIKADTVVVEGDTIAGESLPENERTDANNFLSSDSLSRGISALLTSVLKDFDSRAESTVYSQDHLSSAIDRLSRELDQLLEDAPVPVIMQHAAKISLVRKRVSALNLLLKSIQQRIDNMDQMLSMGLQHGSSI